MGSLTGEGAVNSSGAGVGSLTGLDAGLATGFATGAGTELDAGVEELLFLLLVPAFDDYLLLRKHGLSRVEAENSLLGMREPHLHSNHRNRYQSYCEYLRSYIDLLVLSHREGDECNSLLGKPLLCSALSGKVDQKPRYNRDGRDIYADVPSQEID